MVVEGPCPSLGGGRALAWPAGAGWWWKALALPGLLELADGRGALALPGLLCCCSAVLLEQADGGKALAKPGLLCSAELCCCSALLSCAAALLC